jgi:gas vesicle structural protein
MTMASANRAPRPSSLADVLDVVLDKGIVIDAYVRVSLVGIELLTIDARIVVASVDTYLRFAEAVNRLDLREQSDTQTLPELVDDLREGGAASKTKGALEGAKDKVSDFFDSDEDEEEEGNEAEEEEEDERPRRSRSRRRTTSRSRSRR